MGEPTRERAERVLEAGTAVKDLTGVELLALFELRCEETRHRVAGADIPDAGRAAAGRAASLAITYGQEARQRYTEALAHLRGTHNPVDIEALDRDGVTAEQERIRFEDANRDGGEQDA